MWPMEFFRLHAAGIRAAKPSGKDRVTNKDKGFTPSYPLGEDMTHGFFVDVSSLVSFSNPNFNKVQ